MEDNKTGIELIAQERKEQIEKHGFSIIEDAKFYNDNELLKAAMFCLNPEFHEWPRGWDIIFRKKILQKSAKERAVVAGAFIAAHIDRLNYLENGR